MKTLSTLLTSIRRAGVSMLARGLGVVPGVFIFNLIAVTAVTAQPQRFFNQTNLVSNQANRARYQDPDLQNAWGAVASTDGFFWVVDNGTGKATLYDSNGVKSSLVVTLPSPSGTGPSAPTGQVMNEVSTDFLGDRFIFNSEDGTILGWSSGATATIRSNQSSAGAIYKGLALARTAGGAFLFAADFHNNRIDVFDSSYNLVPASNPSRFVDPSAPAGFAPFNVHLVGNQLYVAYARQDENAEDDVIGAGNGFVSIFTTEGTFVRRFATGSRSGGTVRQLNSPWGIAVAPSTFGRFAGDILVGNFGSGRIAAFTDQGRFVGYLSSRARTPIRIRGLWEIFPGGNGVGSASNLYFTAGPNDERNGLFGFIAARSGSQAGSRPRPAGRPTSRPASQSTAAPTAAPTTAPTTAPAVTPPIYPTWMY